MAPDLGKIFGKGSIAEQLVVWDVIGQAISAVLAPELALLTREVNKLLPASPLTPEQLADMVVRHIVEAGPASDYARESGIAPADFARLVQSAGEGLAPGDLAEALRRQIIPENGTGPDSVSFEQGLAESHVRDKWAATIKRLAVREPSPIDALNALLEGQLDQATAFSLYVRFGGDPEHFQWLFNSRGSAPTPLELSQMALRKIIPWDGEGPESVAYHQGFREGPWRDKWEEPYRRLAEYIPPPRTVTALIREGVVTDTEALAFFEASGLTPDLAAKYVKSAHVQRQAAHKDVSANRIRSVAQRGYLDGHLTEDEYRKLLDEAGLPAGSVDEEVQASNLVRQWGRRSLSLSVIKKLRHDGDIDDAQARQRLIGYGFSEEDAQTQIEEWKSEASQGRSGLSESRILSYLVAGVLTPVEAYDRLVAAGIKSSDATFLVNHPDAGPVARKHGSTANDIVAAYKDDVLTLVEAQAKLEDIGLEPDAAALKLRVANVAKNRGPKPKGPGKALSEAHVLEAFKLGLAADTWALRELSTLGYSDAHAALIVAIEEAKMSSRAPDGWTQLT
jgi:hypothetical protein